MTQASLLTPVTVLLQNPLWNGYPNDWGGGSPGDSKSYNSTTYISSVKVTPFNEPADLMYPQTSDLPDGCTPNYHQKYVLLVGCITDVCMSACDSLAVCHHNFLCACVCCWHVTRYASSPSVCHSVWEAYDIAAPAS